MKYISLKRLNVEFCIPVFKTPKDFHLIVLIFLSMNEMVKLN